MLGVERVEALLVIEIAPVRQVFEPVLLFNNDDLVVISFRRAKGSVDMAAVKMTASQRVRQHGLATARFAGKAIRN